MCLSVFIGCRHKLEEKSDNTENCLGIELAEWTPPPLEKFDFVYYLGKKGTGGKLECSCLLMEHLDWTDSGPIVCSDGLYPQEGPCPFTELRRYVEQALSKDSHVMLLCDDSGDAEQSSTASDYDNLLIRPEMIKRGNLIFADISGGIPWRAYYVIADENTPIAP